MGSWSLWSGFGRGEVIEMIVNRFRLQVVWWWPEWKGLRLYRWEGNWALIYRWSLLLGFVEVRRWSFGNRPPVRVKSGEE